jgi:hypothetical protein
LEFHTHIKKNSRTGLDGGKGEVRVHGYKEMKSQPARAMIPIGALLIHGTPMSPTLLAHICL